MGFWELVVLAVGLSMDAFAVSICKGLALQRVSWKECCIAGAWFGGFQALMPLLGYLLGTQFEQFVTSVDHWIAFVLLGIIPGTLLLRYISPFYLLCCINQIYSGALRGAGNSQVPMVIMLGSFVVFRQIYLYIVSHFITNTLLPLAMGYPAGWLVCSAATLIYYRRTSFLSTRLVAEDGSKEDIQ